MGGYNMNWLQVSFAGVMVKPFLDSFTGREIAHEQLSHHPF